MNQRAFKLTYREPPPGSEAANAGIPTALRPQDAGPTVHSQIGHESGRKPREEVGYAEFYQGALQTERPFAFTSQPAIAPIIGNHWKNRLQVVKHWPRIPSNAVTVVENVDDSSLTIVDRSCNAFTRSPEMQCEYFFGRTILGESVNSAYAHVIEYDLDDQDLNWLHFANAERKKLDMPPISTHDMVLLMDCFEKGWFALSRASRRLCASANLGNDSAIVCDICRESDTVLDNIIVICDCCNIAVHQDCYGVSLVPEGPWFCQRCTSSDTPVCAVCPWTLGPFQQTTDKHLPWIHATCASFLTGEVSDLSEVQLRKISGIPAGRWKLSCVICKNMKGLASAPIQCKEKNCFCAFHLYCAEAAGCHIDWKAKLATCPKHSDCESTITALMSKCKSFSDFENQSPLKKLQARSLFSNPVVPAKLIDSILTDTDALVDYADDERQRRDLLHVIARYWALKKARIHGASLVKCFDIDPWGHNLDLRGFKKKVDVLNSLRQLQTLCQIILKREMAKRHSILLAQELFFTAFNPLQTILLFGCTLLRQLDSNKFFEEPVLESEVPDYYTVVKNSCCMQLIVRRVKEGHYNTLNEFMNDVRLIYDNAVLYNEEGTIYRDAANDFWKGAVKIETSLQAAIDQLASPKWGRSCQLAKDAILVHMSYLDNEVSSTPASNLIPSERNCSKLEFRNDQQNANGTAQTIQGITSELSYSKDSDALSASTLKRSNRSSKRAKLR